MTDYIFNSLFIIISSSHCRYCEYLQAGRSDDRIRAGAKDFSLFQNTHTVSGAYPAPCSMVFKVPSPVWNARTVILTTFLHLPQSLRMSGVMYLLHPYAFVAWAGTVLSFSTFLGVVAILRGEKKNLLSSVRPNRTTRFPPGQRFMKFENFSKIRPGNSSFIEIWQE